MKLFTVHFFLLLVFCFFFSPFSYSADHKYPHRPLNILVIETYFPPVTSTAALNQITGFVRSGHRVDIWAKNRGSLEWAHKDVKKYNLMQHAIFGDLPTNLDKYDVIYCMFGYRGKDLVDSLKNRSSLRHAKLITCFRGADISEYVKNNSRNCYKELFAKGDLFLPVCDYFKNKLIELGCDPRKIVIHHSAIDCTFFPFKQRTLNPNEPIRIVSVGRLIKKKGLEYSIRAVAELIKKYPRIEYSIVGFGELEDQLNKLIKSLKVQNNIKLVGRLTQEGVASILSKSHIFVLPSVVDKSSGDEEGIPNSLKEAMAMGLPVVSTYHAGIPELVQHGYSGILVAEKDTKSLTKAIEYLINNPTDWPKLTYAARKTIEIEYEKESLNKKLNSLLYAVAG